MPTPRKLPVSGLKADVSTGEIPNWYAVNDAVNNAYRIYATSRTTDYTLRLQDSGEIVESATDADIAVTVPPSSSVGFLNGTIISLCRYGSGGLTVKEGSGVTIRTQTTLRLRARYSMASLRYRGGNEWLLTGDLDTDE